jgi:hypothetical protein
MAGVACASSGLPSENYFYFKEETYRFDDDEYVQDYYWSPSYISGLYDSAEAAEQAAHIELPWLRGESSN